MARSIEKVAADEMSNPTPVESPHDLVSVRLFKDSGRYADDVTVGVNGKIFRIQRGVEVKVPRYVAEVLEQSDRQDIMTAQLIDEKKNEYRASANALT